MYQKLNWLKMGAVFLAVFSHQIQAVDFAGLKITNIRVGQGDSTLIQGPLDSNGDRINVLFDAGDIPSLDGGNILRAVLKKNEVEKLDHVIISHDDADHLGGVASGGIHGKSFVLGFNNAVGCEGDDDGDGQEDWLDGHKYYLPDMDELGKCDDLPVVNWIDYGEVNMRVSESQAIRKYNGIANAMGTRTVIADQAMVDSFEIPIGGGAKMIALAGNGYVRGAAKRVDKVTDPNEKSLSFLVTYGTFDFLISGDLIGRKTSSEVDAKVEEAVGKAVVELGRDVDVLHVNHHGANNGSATKFLDLIKPNIAIISAGNGNTHEHPINATLERLYDANVYRIIQTSWGTSEEKISDRVRYRQAIYQSDIVITSDGKTYDVSSSRNYKTDTNYVSDKYKNAAEQKFEKPADF